METQTQNQKQDLTIREMLEAGVHFGHQTRFWSPKMAPHLYGKRNKIHIIDLDKALPFYIKAYKYVETLVKGASNSTILFVGTKRQARETVKNEAMRAGMPYIDYRWLGGTLTNFDTIKKSIKKLKEMKAEKEAGVLDSMSKKEALKYEREYIKLDKAIGGIQDMTKLPTAIFIIDVGYHKIAVEEATKLGIPIIGVVDTNHSPDGIHYVMPGNDDSSKAIALYASYIANAIGSGREKSLKSLQEAIQNEKSDALDLDNETLA